MTMDVGWALEELNSFTKLAATRLHDGWYVSIGSEEQLVKAAAVSEQIVERVLPAWRQSVNSSSSDRWAQLREAAFRAGTLLERQKEVEEKLGDTSPRLSASQLHPWVWGGARTLWASSHYRNAVGAAALAVNDFTQTKVGRRDVSETKLFQKAFSLNPPEQTKPRLRVWPSDGSPTYESIHKGATAFATGLYSAIRNPSSHVLQQELPDGEALEQLAAFSVLARWVDSATLLTVEMVSKA